VITKYTVENDEYVTDKTSENAGEWEESINKCFGPSGFLRFFTVDHGRWMGFYGREAKAKNTSTATRSSPRP
jgi:hypothetical protein